jgi:diamine N-acetyltransferase
MSTERFSREQLKDFIENQRYGIAVFGQLRMVVCRQEGGDTIGLIDLFDFDEVDRSAGIGILVCDPEDRRRGYGKEALALIEEHARQVLGILTLWCIITPDNEASITLFSGAGFARIHNDNYVPSESLFFIKRLLG